MMPTLSVCYFAQPSAQREAVPPWPAAAQIEQQNESGPSDRERIWRRICAPFSTAIDPKVVNFIRIGFSARLAFGKRPSFEPAEHKGLQL